MVSMTVKVFASLMHTVMAFEAPIHNLLTYDTPHSFGSWPSRLFPFPQKLPFHSYYMEDKCNWTLNY